MLHRFAIAIKDPLNNNYEEILAFLDEAKSMVQIGDYHNHIVNLQGIIYETSEIGKNMTQVIM